MHGQSWSLGEVFTVIKDKPYRFSVTAHDNADTHDPLGQNPLLYWFKDQDRGTRPDDLTFNVVVSRRMARMDAVGQPLPESHQRAIRFGLISKDADPERTDFSLKTDTLAALKSARSYSGKELRGHILRFFWIVNRELPRQSVGIPDLCDNFYATEQAIQDWVNRLADERLIERVPGSRVFRENRGRVNMRPLVLTADTDRLDRVEREVSSIDKTAVKESKTEKKHRVFISYSHNDRHTAGEIKQQLEGLGLEAFLAHEDIEPSQEWCKRIKSELKRCDSFVPLITNSFRGSKWTDQESGWAMALKKTICPIMCDDDPHGFLSEIQAVKFQNGNIAEVCREIHDAVTNSSNGKA